MNFVVYASKLNYHCAYATLRFLSHTFINSTHEQSIKFNAAYNTRSNRAAATVGEGDTVAAWTGSDNGGGPDNGDGPEVDGGSSDNWDGGVAMDAGDAMAVAMKAATKSGRSAAAAAGVALTCSKNKMYNKI